MRVAGIQLDIAWEDREENLKRVTPWIDAATAAGANLIVLPEMFACGFSMQTERIGEPVNGPTSAFLREQAARCETWICGSIAERAEGAEKPHNSLVIASPDGTTHRYQKIHPFTFADEHKHYAAGTQFLTCTIAGVECTFFVCYDLRFADEFWQTAKQTNCYVVVANWPAKRRRHWSTLLAARAIENQAYVVGVNRVGEGGGVEYSGDSVIFDPWGEALASAAGGETMILADIDPKVVARARERFPIIPDRR